MSNDSDKPFALRDPMRQLDAAFAIARKMKHSTGEVPEGMMEDINATIKRVEKAFVLDYESLKPDIQKRIRKLIKNIKRLDNVQLGEHLANISRSIRHLLNHVLMNSELEFTITDELGEVPSLPTENFELEPEKPAETKQVNKRSSPPRIASPMILVGAIIGVCAAMGAAYAIFRPGMRPEIPETNTSTSMPLDNTPEKPIGEDEPDSIDVSILGYPDRLDKAIFEQLDPLDSKPEKLNPAQILPLLLAAEYQVALIEPERIELKYEDLLKRLNQFADAAIVAELSWRKGQGEPVKVQPFIEAFIEFAREEMQLQVYVDGADKVLVSDLLYSAGGTKYALTVLYQVLAASSVAPISILSPNGPARPVVGQKIGAEILTYNGESFGSRTSAPMLSMTGLMLEFARRLLPTMETAEGELLVTAWQVHFAASLSTEQLRKTLGFFKADWLKGIETDDEAAEAIHRAAKVVYPYLLDQLVKEEGTAAEALKMFKLARVAKDKARTEAALLALGKRAEPKAMLEGEPLAWQIAENFFEQKMLPNAIEWWKRTLDEFPEDTRPALRLSIHGDSSNRHAMLLEAYRRGDHSAYVIRRMVDYNLAANSPLLALALLDELCEESADAVDLQDSVLLCLEMGKVEWALARLANHSDTVASEPALKRLELICELQANGLSDRAVELASVWRATNPDDTWLKDLLERHGG